MRFRPAMWWRISSTPLRDKRAGGGGDRRRDVRPDPAPLRHRWAAHRQGGGQDQHPDGKASGRLSGKKERPPRRAAFPLSGPRSGGPPFCAYAQISAEARIKVTATGDRRV